MQMQYNKWNELSTSYIFTSALTVATEHRTWLQGFVPLLDTFPKMTIVQAKMEWINARNKNNQRRIKDKTWVLKKSARKKCERVCIWCGCGCECEYECEYVFVFINRFYHKCVLCIVHCWVFQSHLYKPKYSLCVRAHIYVFCLHARMSTRYPQNAKYTHTHSNNKL